ncbi:MAG: MarR family winged helix-turn-helix transcriptional regulator [Acidobacteriaceae bacterium]
MKKNSLEGPVAFLLAQIGSHAARQFAARLAPMKLTPPHAGILRILTQFPSRSQRELAAMLHMHASRLVAIVDELESLGLVLRQGNAGDRRSYSLHITEKGREAFLAIGQIGRQHNDALCASLNKQEREQLLHLLQRIADEQGLTRGVHPGFSRLGEKGRQRGGAHISAEDSPDT